MSQVLSPDEVAAGDLLAEESRRSWGWRLAGGIIAVILGFLMMSWRHETLHVFSIFVAIIFLLVGLIRLIDVFVIPSRRWTSLLVGILAIGVGIALLAWPSVTYFIITIALSWTFLLWGIVEIIASFSDDHAPWWWARLLFGIASLLIGVWVLRHAGHALSVLVFLAGLWVVIFGAVEFAAALSAHHAEGEWEATKRQAGV